MIYVGMDVSSKGIVVHAVDDKKKVLFEDEIGCNAVEVRGLLGRLGRRKKRVVFEAGNQLKWLADCVENCGNVELHVVHPNELKWISESSGKTDKIDARKMAELARGDLLPRKVHIVRGDIRRLRELISARTNLMRKRVSLINSLKGYALQEGKRYPKGYFSNGKWEAAMDALPFSEGLKKIVGSIMPAIESLKCAEEKLTKEIAGVQDERLELLESIPGIGTLTAATLLSGIDIASRFDNKKSAAKYGALSPRIYQSGNITRLGRINHDGRQEIRRVLLQCAHTVVRMKAASAKPLKEFFYRIEKRRNKKIALVALSRKLLTIAYGVLRDSSFYDPSKLVPQSA